MFEIRYVSELDKLRWFSLDKDISENEFLLKVRDQRGYVICCDNNIIGIMRYNLIWDKVPFLTLILFDKAYRRKGLGRKAILFWEEEMRNFGHSMVMTSTQVDEDAQHFYRKLGYVDRGSLYLDNTPFQQPQEMFMLKVF